MRMQNKRHNSLKLFSISNHVMLIRWFLFVYGYQRTYDGGITLPVNTPTKTGYTFVGWRVRHMLMYYIGTIKP